jgi:NAD(P)-dependent dehydrogenase (short-subunit alcohol dehydrogenase family)
MDLGLGGQRALVTGGSDGIGRVIARTLGAEGVHVALCGRDAGKLDAAAGEVEAAGGKAITIQADLRDRAQIERMVADAVAGLGGVDILVNCAGAARRVDPLTGDDDAFVEAMELKYLSYVRSARTVAALMVEQGHGRIVSVIGAGGVQPMPVHLAGGAANAALILFTKGFGRVLAPMGVLVNAVNPGPVRTARSWAHYEAMAQRDGTTVEQSRTKMLSGTSIGREAEPEEVADLVTFLCSARCSYLVGETVNIDGGLVAGT